MSRKPHDEKQVAKISAKQQRALEALLVGGSDAQAADVAGVTRTTVTQWRHHVPEFKEAIRTARRDLLARTSARLHAATTIAVKTLEDVAKDPSIAGARGSSSRVSAARSIIELSQNAVSLEDVQVRIEALEAHYVATNGPLKR